jgi:hypothetical protein
VSTFARRELGCRCGATFTAHVADSVHAVTAPRLRAAILDGTFHTFTCAACGWRFRLEKPLAYTDFARRQWLISFPPEQVSAYRELEATAAASFRDTMVVRCPPIVREWSTEMTRRTVFGLAALREKLVIADLGLDDRVVELLKLHHAAVHGLGLDSRLELIGRTDDGLVFDAAVPEVPSEPLVVPGLAYARLAALGADIETAAAPVRHGAVVDWRIAIVEAARAAATMHASAQPEVP